MYDRGLIIEMLKQIERSLMLIEEEMSAVSSIDDFLSTPTGMLLLDGVCMNLFAVGETVKNIDKYTLKTLFVNYPSIPWQDIMRMRDVIAHHYFDVDAERVFAILRNDVPPLLEVIRQIEKDLEGA